MTKPEQDGACDDDGGRSVSDDERGENDGVSPLQSDAGRRNGGPNFPYPAVVDTGIPLTTAITVAVPAESAAVLAMGADSKRARAAEAVHQKAQGEESKRVLFQRLWTDEDEILLLRGFLDYTTSQRGGSDTAPFYEQIRSKLQIDFNRNQLVEKLRRLKKKYRNAMDKISAGKDFFFKNPHDQATFEIARKIWNRNGDIIGFEVNVLDVEETNHRNGNNGSINLNISPSYIPHANFELEVETGVEKKSNNSTSGSRKRSRLNPCSISSDGFVPSNEYNDNSAGSGRGARENIGEVIEETVKSCLSPGIKEVFGAVCTKMTMIMGGNSSGIAGGMGLWSSLMMMQPPLSFGARTGLTGPGVVDDKWRRQQISELEVYSKRLKLVQDHIQATLQDLRSVPGGRGD